MDVRDYNRRAWDGLVERGDRWTVPVSPETIEAARRGEWSIVLTPTKPVPREWFPPLEGREVLVLAGGGGQQGPVLAAAGATVTVLDNSPRQLEQDQRVARRDGLTLHCREGDMADLSGFGADSFDLIVHPCSNCFVPDVRKVWRECSRVVRQGGAVLSGFINPLLFLFSDDPGEAEDLTVRYRIPYSDLESLGEEDRLKLVAQEEPMAFGHTLDDLLGGQLDAGLLISGFYEDTWPDRPISRYIASFMATRAVKGTIG